MYHVAFNIKEVRDLLRKLESSEKPLLEYFSVAVSDEYVSRVPRSIPGPVKEENVAREESPVFGFGPRIEPSQQSMVSHPSHYNSGKIEVIEALEDWKLDFHAANAVKYIARAGRKDPTKEIEDLEKSVWYLNRKIELLKANKEGREVKRPNDMVKR